MATKLKIIFYSMYGHIFSLTQAIAQGANEVKDVEVEIFRVPELVPEDILEKSGAKEIQKTFAHVPIIKVDQLADTDGYIFGTPTRFGNMCAQMRNFLDQLGGLWVKNIFVGKVGSVYTCTGTQHGGQETTITSFHHTLIHLGMVIVGVPYAEKGLTNMQEITGGSPYGAATLAGNDGKRKPSENELNIARYQGKHVAEITRALKLGSIRKE